MIVPLCVPAIEGYGLDGEPVSKIACEDGGPITVAFIVKLKVSEAVLSSHAFTATVHRPASGLFIDTTPGLTDILVPYNNLRMDVREPTKDPVVLNRYKDKLLFVFVQSKLRFKVLIPF